MKEPTNIDFCLLRWMCRLCEPCKDIAFFSFLKYGSEYSWEVADYLMIMTCVCIMFSELIHKYNRLVRLCFYL